MSGSGREAIPDVREWSGGPPGCPGVVGRPSRMSGSGQEALPNVRAWSRGHPECLGVVLIPSRMSRITSRMSGSGQESPLMSRSGREVFPEVWEWLGDPP